MCRKLILSSRLMGLTGNILVVALCVVLTSRISSADSPPNTIYLPLIMKAIPFAAVGYNFETDIEGWNTSEGGVKKAELDTTNQVVGSGSRALRLTTELFGDSPNEIYWHTEATAYFNRAVPEGIDTPGSYNLTGKRVSCFVYPPAGLATGDDRPAYIRIFVKDTGFDNHFGEPVNIDSSTINRWIELSLVVGVNAPDNFNADQTNTLGIRIDAPSGAALHYDDPIYIDACSIEYP